jgi:flagellar biosynthesis protein FliR
MDAAGLEQLMLAPAAYLPVLARVGAVLAVAPPFASMAVPPRVRALLALALTIGLLPAASASTPPASTSALLLALSGEVMIGLAMGFALSLVFAAAQWAGEIVAQQMGLNLSEIYDPAAGGQSTGALGHAYWLLAVVVFLGANGHHAMLRGLAASFDAVPVMSASLGQPIIAMLTGLLGAATVLALHLAAPVFVTLLVADLAIGMVGRTVPQLGVMTAGVTVRSAAGLLVLIGGMFLTASVMGAAGTDWVQTVQSSFAGMAGR